jgi:hypothetical protein
MDSIYAPEATLLRTDSAVNCDPEMHLVEIAAGSLNACGCTRSAIKPQSSKECRPPHFLEDEPGKRVQFLGTPIFPLPAEQHDA